MKKNVFVVLLVFCLAFLYAETNLKLYQDMIVTENLRLRNPYHDSFIETVLNAGTRVKIIEIDKEETIDGITSNWVIVEVQDGATDKDGNPLKYGVVGKCFAGYLAETDQIPHKADYAGGNGTIILESEDEDKIITVRKHCQTIKIGDMARGEERKIYSDMNKSEMIYDLKDNDELEISEIWTITRKDDGLFYCWFKVKSNGFSGFLCYSEPVYLKYYNGYKNSMSDPYENNKWEILETIESGGEKWTVRKMAQELTVWGGVNKDEIELFDNPGETGTKVIGYIPASYRKGNSQINVEIEAITEEVDTENGNYRWARITFDGKTGWIDGYYLGAERGGPKYYIPESSIAFYLGWY